VTAQVVVQTAAISEYGGVAVEEAAASHADEHFTVGAKSAELMNTQLGPNQVSILSDADVLVEVQPVAFSLNADDAVDFVIDIRSDADERITGLRDAIAGVIRLECRSESACGQFGLMFISGRHDLRADGECYGSKHHAQKGKGKSFHGHIRSISGECQLRLEVRPRQESSLWHGAELDFAGQRLERVVAVYCGVGVEAVAGADCCAAVASAGGCDAGCRAAGGSPADCCCCAAGCCVADCCGAGSAAAELPAGDAAGGAGGAAWAVS